MLLVDKVILPYQLHDYKIGSVSLAHHDLCFAHFYTQII